jgi:hypothetical protein
MKLRNIFSFFSKPFHSEPVAGADAPVAGSAVNILLCNDEGRLHDDAKTIARHLRAMGHEIEISCVDNEKEVLRHLEKLKKNGKPAPGAFFLDVGGVGQKTALKVIKWFEENRPGTPLPDIHFLSLDISMGINEATRLRESDSRIMASFVDRDELSWLEDYLSGYQHPHRAVPTSSAFREVLNARLGTSLPLDHSESSYVAEIKKMRGVTNNDVIAAWQRGKLTAEEAVERLRNYSSGVAAALREGFYAQEGEAGSGLKLDTRFYGSTGFPVKGPVVFSLQEAKDSTSAEKPVLVMRGYDPDVVPLLASGKLGGLVVTSTYMASHLKLLCETHMVSGLFGLIPPGEKSLKREFNEEARPIFPAYFEGDTAEIGGKMVKKGQTVLAGYGGGCLILDPPETLQVKTFDASSVRLNDKLRADLTNLQKINKCFSSVLGVSIGVKANIESSHYRVLNAVKGIGLVRTEQMTAADTAQAEALKSILLHDDAEGYKKLFTAAKWEYTSIFAKLNEGHPVKIRLFDFVHQEVLDKEEQKQFLALYPKLDMHGGEALAAWPRLYREQVATIFDALKFAKASGDPPLEIMMPSVRTEKDVVEIKTMVNEEARRLGVDPEKYSFGVMIETLESCENIAKIVPHCDFISFGTNDLTQQMFDISRSDLKAHAHFAGKRGFDPFKKLAPEVLSLVETVVARGRQAHPGLKIDVCGAQAADPETAAALHRFGVNNISVAPSLGNLYALPVLLNYKIYDSLPGKNKPAPDMTASPQ